MAFRRLKANAKRRSRQWHAWIEQHRSALVSFGLPAAVYLDEERWYDFLENGHLHWHDNPSAFEFGQLTAGQLAALRRFLEQQYGQAQRCPPLLRWARVRCEGENEDLRQ